MHAFISTRGCRVRDMGTLDQIPDDRVRGVIADVPFRL